MLDRHPSLARSIRVLKFGINISAQTQADILSRAIALQSAYGVSTSLALPVLVDNGLSYGLRQLGIVTLKGTRLQFNLPLQHFTALTSLTVCVETRFHACEDSGHPVIRLDSLATLTLESCSTSVIDILQRAMFVKNIAICHSTELAFFSLPNLVVLNVRSLTRPSSCLDGLMRSLGQNLRHALVSNIPHSLWTCTPRLVDLDVFDDFRFDGTVIETFGSARHPTLQNMRLHCSLFVRSITLTYMRLQLTEHAFR